jgi:hypothetical protein
VLQQSSTRIKSLTARNFSAPGKKSGTKNQQACSFLVFSKNDSGSNDKLILMLNKVVRTFTSYKNSRK